MRFSWFEAMIVSMIVLILVAVGWDTYRESQRPTIELKKDDWECVKSEQQTHWQSMPVGKVMVLQPITSTVCVEYRRHAN